MAESSLWQRFQRYFLRYDDLDFSIDISRMKFPEGFFDKMQGKVSKPIISWGLKRGKRQQDKFSLKE